MRHHAQPAQAQQVGAALSLWVDAGPATTMPIPATIYADPRGTPVSTTQLLDLGPGQHLVQIVVRSPNSVPIILSHSHLVVLTVQ